jgi:hypothetical protein
MEKVILKVRSPECSRYKILRKANFSNLKEEYYLGKKECPSNNLNPGMRQGRCPQRHVVSQSHSFGFTPMKERLLQGSQTLDSGEAA